MVPLFSGLNLVYKAQPSIGIERSTSNHTGDWPHDSQQILEPKPVHTQQQTVGISHLLRHFLLQETMHKFI